MLDLSTSGFVNPKDFQADGLYISIIPNELMNPVIFSSKVCTDINNMCSVSCYLKESRHRVVFLSADYLASRSALHVFWKFISKRPVEDCPWNTLYHAPHRKPDTDLSRRWSLQHRRTTTKFNLIELPLRPHKK